MGPETHTTLRLEARSMDKPDDLKTPPRSRVETVKLQGRTFTRYTFLPGFHWKDDVGPLFKSDHCPGTHFMYQVSGRLRVRMKDGTELLLGPGEAQVIPPGHDVWVLGDAPFVGITID